MYGWGILPGMCGNRWVFGFNGCLVTNYPGKKHTVYQANLALGPIEATGQTPAQSKFALQAQDNDSGHSRQRDHQPARSSSRARRSSTRRPTSRRSSAGVSFTPFVQAIKAANPNILLTLTDFQTAPGLTAAMTASGYTGANVNYVGLHPGPARHLGAARGGVQRRLREQPDGAGGAGHAVHQADAEGPDRGERQDRQLRHAGQLASPTPRPTCWSRS